MITVKLPFRLKYPVLALGADTKGAFALGKGQEAFLVNGFGDLSDIDNYSRYERAIKTYMAKLKIRPKRIVCDAHPGYFSTNYALRITHYALRDTVQHHAAHVVASIVDNLIKGEVIGVAFDGTGYGLDGNIWGGEFFIGSIGNLRRIAHFKYIPMPGGEAAVREPWRMAFSLLYDAYGADRVKLGYKDKYVIARSLSFFCRATKQSNIHWLLDCFSRPEENKCGIAMTDPVSVGRIGLFLKKIIDNRINSPLTSSMGRLFDGVGSMILSKGTARFEAEIPMELERTASKANSQDTYDFNISREGDNYTIDLSDVIKGVVRDLSAGVKTSLISAKFHNSIAKTVLKTSLMLRKRFHVKRIVLTGGVFQNAYLVKKTHGNLVSKGFNVYSQKNVPINDAGIPIGQIALATNHHNLRRYGG